MSAFFRAFPQIAEIIGFGLICVALWLVSPILALLFAGICLILAAYGIERRKRK